MKQIREYQAEKQIREFQAEKQNREFQVDLQMVLFLVALAGTEQVKKRSEIFSTYI